MKMQHMTNPGHPKESPCCVNQGVSYSPTDDKRYSHDPDYNISMLDKIYRQHRVQTERQESNAWNNQKMAEEGLNMRQRI